MDFDLITTAVKKAFDTYVENIVVYIISALIAVFGSCFIITSAPLAYGLYSMILKGTRGEKAEIKDILYGFSSLDIFIRSWIGVLALAVIPICISIAFTILSMVLVAISSSLGFLVALLSLCMIIVIFALVIFLYYSLFIYVMTPSENIIYAIKESIAIAKENLIMVILTVIIAGILGMFTITIPLGWTFAAYMLKELKPDLKDNAGL